MTESPFSHILRQALRQEQARAPSAGKRVGSRWDFASVLRTAEVRTVPLPVPLGGRIGVGGVPRCFELLGLERGSSVEDARRAYRRLAFALHPDRGGSHDAFVVLQQAYRQALGQLCAA